MLDVALSLMPRIARVTGRRILLLVVLTGFGLTLGACSKCDVWNWTAPKPAPHSCHSGPDPQ